MFWIQCHLKHLITLNFALILFKRSVKKNMLPERFVYKENVIYKEKFYSIHL